MKEQHLLSHINLWMISFPLSAELQRVLHKPTDLPLNLSFTSLGVNPPANYTDDAAPLNMATSDTKQTDRHAGCLSLATRLHLPS